jgi:anti-sigma factor RsiW
MKSHEDYDTMIQLFIDDELPEGEREEFLAHFKNCGDCQKILEEAKAFSETVRRARPQVQAPAALRARVLNQMDRRTHNKAGLTALTQIQAAVRLYWRPLSMAAMLCIVVGGGLSISHFRRVSLANDFIRSAVANHRKFEVETSLDITSSSPQEVSSWFAQRVSFPFRMPNAGIASDDRAKYKLMGGRLVDFGGQRAALVVFQMPNNRISLLVSSDKLAKAMGGKITQSSGLRFHARDMNELHIATWDNKGLTYALVSSVAMGSSGSCSTCHRSSATGVAKNKKPQDVVEHVLQASEKNPLQEIIPNSVGVSAGR